MKYRTLKNMEKATKMIVSKGYETIVAKKDANGKVFRLWDGWSYTTGRHIIAFCGMNKAQFIGLPYGELMLIR